MVVTAVLAVDQLGGTALVLPKTTVKCRRMLFKATREIISLHYDPSFSKILLVGARSI